MSTKRKASAAARKFRGMRLDDELYGRMERVAKAQRTSVRAIVEQCIDASLPVLETAFGIRSKGKAE